MIFRSDNRSPDQMRPVNILPDFISTAEGSCLIELGNTRVICTATIEDTVPPFLRNSGKGWVTSEYGMLPRSTLTRTPREVTKGRAGGRTHEIQRLIGRSLRAVTDMEKLGERTIFLDCDVIQADGGTRTASITGAFVAMGLAMRRMVEAGSMSIAPIRDYVAATSIGIVDGEIMLDLCYEEDAARRSRHERRRHRQQEADRSPGHSRAPPIRRRATCQDDGPRAPGHRVAGLEAAGRAKRIAAQAISSLAPLSPFHLESSVLHFSGPALCGTALNPF